MGKQLIEGAKRTDLFNVDPALLVAVAEDGHPLDDPDRVKIPVNEEAARAFADEEGDVPPVFVRKEGDGDARLVIIDGRQRVKNAVRGNELRAARGDEPRTVAAVVYTEDGKRGLPDDDAIALMLSSNGAVPEEPVSLARKLQRLVETNPEKWTVARIAREVLRKGERHTQDLLALAGLAPAAARAAAAVNAGKGLRIAALAEVAKIERPAEQVKAIEEMEAGGATTGTRAVAAARRARGVPARKVGAEKARREAAAEKTEAPVAQADTLRSKREIVAYRDRLDALIEGKIDGLTLTEGDLDCARLVRGVLRWALGRDRRSVVGVVSDLLPPQDA